MDGTGPNSSSCGGLAVWYWLLNKICNTELKMQKASKHTFFENLEYSIKCKVCEKTVQNR